MGEQELALLKNRLQVYEFFASSLLNKPTVELLETLQQENDFFASLTEKELVQPKLYDLEVFIQEYYDRFFVPTSGLYVPPYESAIRGRKEQEGELRFGGLNGRETHHVSSCYQAVSFQPQKLNMFAPLGDIRLADHLALELAFLNYLCQGEVMAYKQAQEKQVHNWQQLQEEFLTEHLNCWLLDYTELVKKKGSGLYSYLMQLISAWVEIDLAFLVESNK
ncbi:TorD/DmsD family molecular chaperone [Fuchsiella alkaliacetigena]|uniref:TorD/DmsD family molecular chaperone n=1 Tax=Fuchsiella alkaliacetigena TaxID=957042 RepID=UPI002009E6C0|nr:molecular chaperone TorD family protein [Fuchsiella alkaliacetigena]MCK8823983.1 molecular chaperone TorD family protein [Fuchsiella alkaliacetigena]